MDPVRFHAEIVTSDRRNPEETMAWTQVHREILRKGCHALRMTRSPCSHMLSRLLLVLFVLVSLAGVRSRAQNNPEWTEPFPPHRIAGNLYYVGSKDLAAFLVVTPEGNILINSNLESSVPQIKASIEKLGFRFSDTKILLISHAHLDHAAGSATIKRLTGAKYMVMDADVPVVEDGGKTRLRVRTREGLELYASQGGPGAA